MAVPNIETSLDIRHPFGYIRQISLIEGAFPEGMPEKRSECGPRGRNCQSAHSHCFLLTFCAACRKMLRPARSNVDRIGCDAVRQTANHCKGMTSLGGPQATVANSKW